MRPGKVDRAELTAERRASILDAARCVFARKGYADTVVDDLAEQAGIGKGTLYLYFRSKSDVYLAALMEDARRLDELTRERMQAATTWDGKLRAFIQTKLDYLEANPDSARIYLAEFRSMMLRGLPVPSELHRMIREAEGKIAQIIAAGIARGESREV